MDSDMEEVSEEKEDEISREPDDQTPAEFTDDLVLL